MEEILNNRQMRRMAFSIAMLALALFVFMAGGPLANSTPISMGPVTLDGPFGGGFYDQGIIYSPLNYLGVILLELSLFMALGGIFIMFMTGMNLDMTGEQLT